MNSPDQEQSTYKKKLNEEVAARQKMETSFIESESAKDLLLKTALDAFVQIKSNGVISYWNDQAESTFGWPRKEAVGSILGDLIVPPEYREAHKKGLKYFLRTGEGKVLNRRMTLTALHRDGHVFPVRLTIWSIQSGSSFCFNAFIEDITNQKKQERSLRLAMSVFENMSEAVIVTDTDTNIISVNPAFTRITGYPAHEIFGENPRILQSGRHSKDFYRVMWEKIHETGYWEGEIWNRKKNGETYPEWLVINTVRDETGKIIEYIGLSSDITQRKKDEEKLYRGAHYDALTGLANRTLFSERFLQAIKRVKRTQGSAALLFVDLDKFKNINDTLGHLAGDTILKETANRLITCVREIDTVARPSGDEFLIVLSDVSGRQDVTGLAKKIIKKLSKPFKIEGHEIFIGASIGISMIPDDGESVQTLLRDADMAMYKAKTSGGSRIHFFNQEMEKQAKKQVRLEWDLKKALENQEFKIVYQPIVDMGTMKTIGLESLIRWEHPNKGCLMPSAFIPIAEGSNLIGKIGGWVLREVCKQAKKWREDYGHDAYFTVNTSSRQFIDGEFLEVLHQALEESEFPSEFLTIEITESLILNPTAASISTLQDLKKTGINIAIDDFGTGYSSLSYLMQYPIDLLKVDKSFIIGMHSDPKKRTLVDTILQMSRGLEMKTIAEGIETEEDLSYLKAHGCSAGQGFYISKPLSPEAYETVLKEGKNTST